ncbi:glycosyl transferase [Marinilongibacter aquaticus]|uniref:glycosyltransferase family protein n=1 Tax=Marinilongibacter aquaticus TaxID=2975157 RepID=UPI0021BD8440|nr:glycosyltransferase family protein [Marinilongibacter aquaticus]UBM58851.1 glycosyl transferase [Marinilongibacter aquaticus]
MKLLFVVQGEGRGHQTQAISLWQQLQETEHEVVACLVGKANEDDFSAYLGAELTCPVHYFQSPNLVYNAEGKGLSLSKTFTKNVSDIPKYWGSLNKMQGWIREYKPDLILNFYDLLCGFYQMRFAATAPPMLCIGHQYLLLHNQFEFPEGRWFDRMLINMNSRLTAFGAKKLMALSFSPVMESKRVISVPPLIRKEVLNHETGKYPYYLAYMTSPDLLVQLKEWHKDHQHIEIHCFIQINQDQEVVQYHKNLFVHKLNSAKFLKLMAHARGLITTAGFESVCEAIYFGKPVMMVPVPNHYEQACNAKDAENFGAGIAQKHFNLDEFMVYVEHHEEQSSRKFRDWLSAGKSRLLSEIERFDRSKTAEILS